MRLGSSGSPERALLRGANAAVGGGLGARALSLVQLALLTHALGPELFGTLALVRSVTATLNALMTFQSWRALVFFGADLREKGDHGALRRLLRTLSALDLGTAVVTFGAILVATIPAAHIYGWSDETRVLLPLYGISVLFSFSGPWQGVLRLAHRHEVMAYAQLFAGVGLTVHMALAMWLRPSLSQALLAYAVWEVVGHGLYVVVAERTWSRAGWGAWWRRDPGEPFFERGRDVLKFMLSTNLSSSFRRAQAELDLMIVGALLGEAATGVYKGAKQLGSLPTKVYGYAFSVLYSELAQRLAAGDLKGFLRRVRQGALLGGGLSALIAVGGSLVAGWALRLVLGPEFAENARVPFIIFLVSGVVFSLGLILENSLVAAGRPDGVLKSHAWMMILYVPTLVVGIQLGGAEGAAGASLVRQVGFFAFCAFALRHLVEELRDAARGEGPSGANSPLDSSEPPALTEGAPR